MPCHARLCLALILLVSAAASADVSSPCAAGLIFASFAHARPSSSDDCISSSASPTAPQPTKAAGTSYSQARSIRLNKGHEAATSHYQALLQENPHDVTAATRIAAANSSPLRHDRACLVSLMNEDGVALGDNDGKEKANEVSSLIEQLRNILTKSGYNRQNVGQLFGLNIGNTGDARSVYPWGPTYLTPVEAGSNKRPPPLSGIASSDVESEDAIEKSSLCCLVSMFLLGFAVQRSTLETCLIGGKDTINLLESLGLAFPCEINPACIVPYVHLFPMDVATVLSNTDGNGNDDVNDMESIVLVTDLHPVALSRTTVGALEDGAVMYIGPDSLALVQHLPLETLLHSAGSRILDLCTGSGIQAISTLAALRKVDPTAQAVCVDVNERAMRFVMFNSMLNGMGDRVQVVKGDLIAGRSLPLRGKDVAPRRSSTQLRKSEDLVGILRRKVSGAEEDDGIGTTSSRFDIILANPPFIPVPSSKQDVKASLETKRRSIDLRYGLFSSGGSDGEDVLRGILRVAPQLLHPTGGFVGIVSEFMDPSEELCRKMEQWWSSEIEDDCQKDASSAEGVLFTNEKPIPASIYAARRADDEDECKIWSKHLDAIGISCVSPGLLYMQSVADGPSLRADVKLHHKLVPKTQTGSIWTPQNGFAVGYTKNHWINLQGR